MTSLGDDRRRGFKRVGVGIQVGGISKFVPVKFSAFQSGLVLSDDEDDVSEDAALELRDMEVSKKDGLIKADGVLSFTALAPPSHSYGITTAVNLAGQSRYIVYMDDGSGIYMFDPYFNEEVILSPFPVSEDVSSVVFADLLIFNARTLAPRSMDLTLPVGSTLALTMEPLIPFAEDIATYAARIYLAGPVIDGKYQPMGIAWSGTASYNAFDFATDLGSGFELLINDQTQQDKIIKLVPMGFDLLAAICSNSIWIGRNTNDPDRPLDFRPRVIGKGAISKRTISSTSAGVMYLAQDGINLFNGNEVAHVSSQIDRAILPIDVTQIRKYHTFYDSINDRFYLFTPTECYVYELKFNRWFRRSLVTEGACILHYSSDAEKRLAFLGVNVFDVQLIGINYPGAGSIFNIDQVARYESKKMEPEYIDRLYQVVGVKVKYDTNIASPLSTIQLTLLDRDGEFTQVLPPVDLAEPKGVMRQTTNKICRGMGIRLDIYQGDPEILEIELKVRVRGKQAHSPTPET